MVYSDDQPRDDNGRWESFTGDHQSDQKIKSFFKMGATVKDRGGKLSEVIGFNKHGQVMAGKVSRAGGVETATDIGLYHPRNLSVKVQGGRAPLDGGPKMTPGNKRVPMRGRR